MHSNVLLVPGLRGSSPGHWQSLWALKHGFRRVLQRDWTATRVEQWSAALDAAIDEARGPLFLVAHGFGCLACLRRLRERRCGVAGLLLVAPRDPADFGLELPEALGLPCILVASRDDPSMHFAHAQRLARRLDARFVDAGHAGGIDAAAGYGPWPRGERLLAKLAAAVAARQRELQVALALVA